MRTINRLGLLMAGVGLVLGGCKSLDAPDQNAATLQDLAGAPTRAAIASASQGLIAGMRSAGPCTGNCAYIGREFQKQPHALAHGDGRSSTQRR